MTLKLNATRDAYREFYGRNIEQMPKLIADNRVPMNVAQLMQRRLELKNGPDEVKWFYMDNYFDTGDAVVYHPNGNVKVVLDSQTLRDMTPIKLGKYGALILEEDVYRTLQGEEFKKEELGKVNKWLTTKDAKSHPVWKVLSRNQTLLDDYVDYIFAEGKQRFDYDTAMGIFSGSAKRNTLEIRAWYVSRLADRSYAYCRNDLDFDYGRFIGIETEILNL